MILYNLPYLWQMRSSKFFSSIIHFKFNPRKLSCLKIWPIYLFRLFFFSILLHINQHSMTLYKTSSLVALFSVFFAFSRSIAFRTPLFIFPLFFYHNPCFKSIEHNAFDVRLQYVFSRVKVNISLLQKYLSFTERILSLLYSFYI